MNLSHETTVEILVSFRDRLEYLLRCFLSCESDRSFWGQQVRELLDARYEFYKAIGAWPVEDENIPKNS